MAPPALSVLALNSGSSSLKFGVFTQPDDEVRATYRGSLDGIGTHEGRLQIRSADGKSVADEAHQSKTQAEAIRTLGAALNKLQLPALGAIGHRIVHGGPSLQEHQRLTPEVKKTLEAAAPFAPLHVPVELSLIQEVETQYRKVPQFVCFDTAFHRTLPEVAARFPLPDKLWNKGVKRYGFHGLSCESIVHSLGSAIPRRMVIAHLGNGASITALANGQSIDTSMGLTPTGGIIMGTRTGDLDPGVLLYLMRSQHFDAEQLEKLLDKQSGLLGISGLSADMRDLHKAASSRMPQLAIEMFARVAKKTIGAFAAVLGGLDLLVFSGGIGEHDSIVRAKICDGLEFLGISLDRDANTQNRSAINGSASRGAVRIIPADEEAQIARHVYRLLARPH